MSKTPAYYHFLPYIILYFFLNNVLLPHGLLYTALLSPVFIYWIYKQDGLKSMIKWMVLIIIPIPFHIYSGFDSYTYLRSTALLITAWIFLFTTMHTVRVLKEDMDTVLKKILYINSLILIIALVILPFESLRSFLWNSVPISPNIPPFPRLDMLAYEPSHYALLLTPVFMFFIFRAISGKLKHPLLYILASFLPLLLSFSFGVIGTFAFAILLSVLIFRKSFPRLQLNAWIYTLLAAVVVFIAINWIFPSNPFWLRVSNILSGSDTSAKGRLFDSFMFAGDLIAKHNYWFGVGPGQVKILAHDLIINHYQYTGNFADVVRIPNSMAEMLATYGIFGFILKLFIEIYYFVKTKVYSNVYALGLFVFIFVYQFTGSFVVNIAEIGIWALVFSYRPEVLQIIRKKSSS